MCCTKYKVIPLYLTIIFSNKYACQDSTTRSHNIHKELVETQWKDGKMNGFYSIYYKNGKLKEQFHFENGKATGKEIYYKVNGSKDFEIYRKGPSITIHTFNNEGNIHIITKYKNKVKDGMEVEYYFNESIFRETPYENGKIHGLEKTYYENGNLLKTTNYFNGTKNGFERLYYYNGNIKKETQYFEGIKNGIEKIYNESLQLRCILTFSSGTLHHKLILNDSIK